MLEAIEMLKKHLKANDKVVLGCSGGPDSMCLLHVLQCFQKICPIKIIVAHVNHNIREDAAMDTQLVSTYCRQNKIRLVKTVFKPGIAKNEASYRRLRYQFFQTTIYRLKAQYLLTAHQGDDLMETILMRISRGSNLNGYSGIKSVDFQPGYCILRPMLFYNKEEIFAYLKKYQIPYCNDYTNDQDYYTRNRYRHHILPFLKEENPNIHRCYLKYSLVLQESNQFINQVIAKAEARVINQGKIIKAKFNDCNSFTKKRILENYLARIYQANLEMINSKNREEIERFIGKNINGSKKITLPLGYDGISDYKYFYIMKSQVPKSFKIKFNNELKMPDGAIIEVVDYSNEKSNFVIRLNQAEIKLPLYFRNCQAGDSMAVKALNGSKKVSAIYIDEKIERERRHTIPLLVDSEGHILWIPGVKKSKFDKEKNEKYDIIIRYRKEEEYEQTK